LNGRLIPGGPGPVDPQGHFLYGVMPWWIHLVEFAFFLAVVLATVLVVWAVLRSPRWAKSHPGATISPALAELDLRYARGEVSREDYLTRRADLSGAPPAALVPPANPAEPAPAEPT
jgi:putative membrane protein